jgi:hypothetical protein
MYLPHFLYTVAAADSAAADALFKDALAAYAARDEVNSLLYLSYYPFALTQPIASVMPSMGVRQPNGFNGDPELQRLFVGAFLGFAERRLAAFAQQPPAEGSPNQRTEPEAIYTALKVLETLYAARRPAALERITALEGQMVAFLSNAKQNSAAAYSKRDLEGNSAAPREGAFESAIEQAGRVPAGRRDGHITMAVLHQSDLAPLETVEAAAQNIEEVEIRKQVLGRVYFRRGHNAAYAGEFDEARTLLGAAHLYARFDYLRGLGTMGEAVAAVNKLNDPDLVAASLPMTIQGKNFSTFAGWPVPTFTLESSFVELGAREFEATLAHANQLGDKYLRATAVLALAAKCLEDTEKPKSPARGTRKQ